MHDNRIILPKIQVAKLEVETENQGLKLAWNFIRGKITASKFASIVFQEQKELDLRGIGGFFTTQSFVNILYLSNKYYDQNKRCLKFDSDRDAAVFLHECSHYIHIASNMGKWTQKDDELVKDMKPARIPITPDVQYYAEREAWQLSLNMDKIFRIGITAEINKINAHNMLLVEKMQGLRKIDIDEVEKIEGSMTIDQFHKTKKS